MNEQHHGILLGGAIGDTTQTAAQLATIVATAAQTMARMRARQLETDRASDQAATNAERAALRSEHAASRLTWNPAFERSFRTSASAAEAAHVWAAAQPWVERDSTAQEAVRRAQERLGVLHPELMVGYQQSLADGMEPVDAMVEATVALTRSPGDLNAPAAARAIAADERGEALEDSAVPDVAATVSVDEHSQGIHAGANHAVASDAASARAALLATQA